MHFYSFNISEYVNGTSYFTNIQDLAYRRLLDLYYDTEQPISNETQSVASRLRLGSEVEDVEWVLREKFTLGDDNKWHHEVCDKVIAKYQSKCAVNKNNGLSGGRPIKNPVVTQTVTKKKRMGSKLRTNNYKLNTPLPPKGLEVVLPAWLSAEVWKDYVEHRKNIKKPLTQKAAELCLKKLETFRAKGFDVTMIINDAIMNGWQGLFAPKPSANAFLPPKKKTTNRKIMFSRCREFQRPPSSM